MEAISLIPEGNFEVDVYLAENDVAKVKVGDPTDITLDAYGSGRNLPQRLFHQLIHRHPPILMMMVQAEVQLRQDIK